MDAPLAADNALTQQPLPPKEFEAPPGTALEVNSLMSEIFNALDTRDRRFHYNRLTVNLRQRLLANAKTALHRNRHTSRAKFTLFPKLPAEIRTRIWRMASETPHIIELEMYASKYQDVPQYQPVYLPPTLTACYESSHETLISNRLALPNYVENELIGSIWLKYDRDILHLRDMDFVERGAYVWPGWDPWQHQILRTNPELSIIRDWDSSDKWDDIPACFAEIEALAVSRDLLVRTLDPYECIIRHFFPKLRLLIVLIDDALDIDQVWEVNKKLQYPYGRYERSLRFGFVQDSLGPFKEVVNNIEYADAVKEEMVQMFKEEEEIFQTFNAPEIHVLSAQMNLGNEQWDSGRYPSNFVLEEDEDEELVLRRVDEEEV